MMNEKLSIYVKCLNKARGMSNVVFLYFFELTAFKIKSLNGICMKSMQRKDEVEARTGF